MQTGRVIRRHIPSRGRRPGRATIQAADLPAAGLTIQSPAARVTVLLRRPNRAAATVPRHLAGPAAHTVPQHRAGPVAVTAGLLHLQGPAAV